MVGGVKDSEGFSYICPYARARERPNRKILHHPSQGSLKARPKPETAGFGNTQPPRARSRPVGGPEGRQSPHLDGTARRHGPDRPQRTDRDAGVLEAKRKAIETGDLERRLAALEESTRK